MASANSRAITKCLLIDECPMLRKKCNLTGSKRKMANYSEKAIHFSKLSSSNTLNHINDIRKDQVIGLKQKINKPVIAVPPMLFDYKDSESLKQFRTYETKPIHSKCPSSQNFISLEFSSYTKKINGRRKIAQVQPFNKVSLVNRVDEIKKSVDENYLFNKYGMNDNLPEDNNSNKSSLKAKVQVELKGIIKKSKVKIRSSQCSKLIGKVTTSNKWKYIKSYKDAKQKEIKNNKRYNECSDKFKVVKNGGWKVGGISYKQMVYINVSYKCGYIMLLVYKHIICQ